MYRIFNDDIMLMNDWMMDQVYDLGIIISNYLSFNASIKPIYFKALIIVGICLFKKEVCWIFKD